MDARVAFMVEDIEELIEKLEQYQNGRENIEHCYVSGGHKGKNAFSQVLSDEDLKTLSETWIASKNMEKLAELGVNGFEFNWEVLYEGRKPRRIPLPTYPFAKKRYWALKPVKTTSGNGVSVPKQLHPLVHENSSNFKKQQFTSRFDGQEFFLTDHRILDKQILPGVAYLEMARAATELSSSETVLAINNNVWMRPIFVADQSVSVTVDLTLQPDGTVHYAVGIPEPSGTDTPNHCQGQIVVGQSQNTVLEKLDLSAINARCSGFIQRKEVYAHCRANGLNYGPSFQGIESIRYNKDELFVRLEVPEVVRAGAESFVLHPSIMDAAVQATLWLLSDESFRQHNGSYMLFAIKGIKLYKPTPLQGYAHIRFSQTSGSRSGSMTYDVDIVNDQGEVCVTYEEMTVRQLTKNSQGESKANVE
jgi:acyl transferase domain-containing protein